MISMRLRSFLDILVQNLMQLCMVFVKRKLLTRAGWFSLFPLFFILFATGIKSLFLDTTPLFGDEALYCYLGYRLYSNPFLQAFDITVNHWKDAPGLPLMNAINFGIFGQSYPIQTCRFVSVVASFVAGVVFLQLVRLFTSNKRVWFASLAFFLLNPFSFFFDRTSLMDAPLVSFVLLFFYFSLIFFKKGKVIYLLLALVSFVFMFFTKFNSLLVLPVIFSFPLLQPQRYRFRRSYYVLVLAALSIVVWMTAYFTKTWETVFYHINDSRNLFSVLSKIAQNIRLITSWYAQVLTPLALVLIFFGFISAFAKKLYSLAFTLPFLVLFYAVVSQNLFPRYFLFTLPFIAILIGFAVRSRWGMLGFLVLMLTFIWGDFQIIFNPYKAPLAHETRYQFFTDWSSGIGAKKAVEYFSKQSKYKPFKVLVPIDLQGLFSMTKLAYVPESVFTYLFFPDKNTMIQLLENYSDSNIFIVSTPSHNWVLEAIMEIDYIQKLYKTNGNERNSIFIYSSVNNE